MLRFIRKINICLSQPRKIGFFMGEKLWVSLLQLALFVVIATIPQIINLATTTEISSSSKDYIEEILMVNEIDNSIKFTGGKMEAEKGLQITTSDGIIFINPNKELLKSYDYPLIVYEFLTEKVVVSFSGIKLYEVSYAELGNPEIDFDKIYHTDYVELELFTGLIDSVYLKGFALWFVAGYLLVFFEIYSFIMMCALALALGAFVINSNISFRFRFKGALDAQFVNIVFVLLASLFNFIYLRYVGIVFSAIYAVLALISILRIEVKKMDEEGDGK